MKNSKIACETITGVGDSLENVNHLDIFGDSTNVPVKAGDICFVITLADISYIYVAIADASPITNGTKSIAMVSGGGFIWKLKLMADKTASTVLPANNLITINDGIIPSGYSAIAFHNSIVDLRKSGDLPQTVMSGNLYIYNRFLYSISQSSNTTFKINIDTGEYTQLDNQPGIIDNNFGAGVGSAFYTFNTKDQVANKLDLTNDTWSILSASPPGTVRDYTMIASASNGKIYIFGGYSTEGLDEVWEYTPVGDTYLQRLDMPIISSRGIAVAVDDDIHLICRHQTTGDIWGLVYDPVLNTWDDTTYGSISQLQEWPIQNSGFYDSLRGEVGVINAFNDYSYQAIGYDVVLGVWMTLFSLAVDIMSRSMSAIYSPVDDLFFHTKSNIPKIGYVDRKGNIIAKKD